MTIERIPPPRTLPQTQERSWTAQPPEPAPRTDPYGGRIPGTAYGIQKVLGMENEEYVPPDWATRLLYHRPDWGSTRAPAQQQQGGYAQTGFPIRAQVDLMGNDGLRGVFGPEDPLRQQFMVGMGAIPGDVRGGDYHGIATAPITLANFATWGREGALALLTSALGMDYQQPEEHGVQPVPKDPLTGALVTIGDAVNGALAAPRDWFFNSNNLNRGKQVRALAATGQATPFLIEWVAASIFPDGQGKFSYQRMAEEAARRGVDVVEMLSTAYDLSPDTVSRILNDPAMSDEELGKLTDGQPISHDPLVAMGLEAGFFAATLAAGSVITGGMAGLAAGGIAGARGIQLASTLGRIPTIGKGARMLSEAVAGTAAARAVAGGSAALRTAARANALITGSGWTIRGLEWGIKQLAVMTDNQTVAGAMDQLMWQMPLSMNPGLNFIDGFRTRVWRPGKVGRIITNSPTEGGVFQGVGRGDALIGGIGVDATGRYIAVAGKVMRYSHDTPEAKVVGRLQEMTLDQMHAAVFSKAGWRREWVEQMFGDGNRYGLTLDDAKNQLLDIALKVVREQRGPRAMYEGLEEATIRGRSNAFVEANLPGALRVLDKEVRGGTDMTDMIRGQFWRLAELNDSGMAVVKKRLTDSYIPEVAIRDFVSYIIVSKQIREAIAAGRLADTAVAGYRTTVNLDYLANFRQHLAQAYPDGGVVADRDIALLKSYGGAIETVGAGRRLGFRKVRRTFTRADIEAIIDDVIAVERSRVPKATTAEAAAYRPGREMGDTFEDQRILGVTPSQMESIRIAREAESLTALPPAAILRRVAREMGVSPDQLASRGIDDAWGAVFQWADDAMEAATETAFTRDKITAFSQHLDTVAMDPVLAREATASLGRLLEEVTNPFTEDFRKFNPSPAAKWDRARAQAGELAGRLDQHLNDPRRVLRTTRSGEQTWAVPSNIPAGSLLDIDRLARLVARDTRNVSPGDIALLVSDSHPLTRLPKILENATPANEAEVARVLREAGLGDEATVDAVYGDLRAVLGADEAVGRGALLDDAAGRADAYANEALDLAGEADAVASAFKTTTGSYSEEVAASINRAELHGDKVARTTRGKSRYNINDDFLDPVSERQQAVTRDQPRLRSQQTRIEKVQTEIAGLEAEKVMALTGTGELTWRRVGHVVKGNLAAKRATAEAMAADVARDTGAPTTIARTRRGYEVLIGDRKPAPPDTVPDVGPPAEPPPAPMALADITASDNRMYGAYEEGTSIVDQLAAAEAEMAVTSSIRTADAEWLVSVRDYTAARVEQITGDGLGRLAVDPRAPLVQVMEQRVKDIDTRLGQIRKGEPPTPLEPTGEVPIPRTSAPSDLGSPVDTEVTYDAAQAAPYKAWEAYRAKAEAVRSGGDREAVDPVTGEAIAALSTDHFAREMDRRAAAAIPAADLTPEVAQRWDAMGVEMADPVKDRLAKLEPEPTVAQADADIGAWQVEARETDALRTMPYDEYHAITRALQDRRGEAFRREMASRKGGPQAPSTTSADTAAPQGADALPGGPAAGAEPTIPAGASDADLVAWATGADAAREALHPVQPTAADRATMLGGIAADEPRPAVYGSDAPFQDPRTERRNLIPSRLRVMEADEIVTSWDEGYDRALQPRRVDRGREDAVAKIARAPDERMLETSTGAEGTPVVGPDGVALAGNHRARGLQIADQAAYDAYRAMLTSRAVEYGIAPEAIAAMRRPVLVREVEAGSMTSEMARALNQPTGGMGIAELAGSLAREITAEDLASLALGETTPLATALTNAGSAGFVRRVMSKLTERQRGEYLDGNDLNKQGRALIEAAVISKVMGADNGDIVRRLVEATDSDLGANLTKGITEAAGQVAVAEAGVPLISDTLAEAVLNILEVKGRSGLTPPEIDQLLRGGLAADAAPEVYGLSRALLGMRSSQEVSAFLRGYADAVPDPNQLGMFSEGTPPLHVLLNAGIDRVNAARNAKAGGSMFGAEELPRVPSPDGTTLHGYLDGAGNLAVAREVPVIESVPDAIRVRTSGTIHFDGDDLPAITTRVQGGTGPFSIEMRSASEADALRAYLAGDDAAYRGEVTRVETDGTTIGIPGEAPPEWFALREATADREVTVVGRGDPRPPSDGIVVVRKPIEVPPDFAEAQGFIPDTAPDVAALDAIRDSGTHAIVSPDDPLTQRVAQTSVGAPRVRTADILEMNEPNVTKQLEIINANLDSANQRLAAAQARLESLRADIGEMPETTALDADTLALWHQYMGGDVHPRTMGGIMDALESIDFGYVPKGMAPSDVSRLRGSLLAAFHRRLDELGAEPMGTTAQQNLERVPRNRWRDPARMTQNDEMGEDLRAVTDEIQRRSRDADGPLEGWEGTQYQIVRAPRTMDASGHPLSPRILPDDYLALLDERWPGIALEMASGRKRSFSARVMDHRSTQVLAAAMDTAVGSRPQQVIARQARDRFIQGLMRYLPDTGFTASEMAEMEHQVMRIVARVHDGMAENSTGWGPGRLRIPKYRAMGMVPQELFEKWAREALEGAEPPWLEGLLAEAKASGQQYPIAEVWRSADNRIREWFRQRPSPVSSFVESLYGGAQGAHHGGSALSVAYNVYRFALDVRYIALELSDAAMLTLGKEGPGAVLDAYKAGQDAKRGMMKLPMAFGPDDLAQQRTAWAWWLTVMDTGGWNRAREHYITSNMIRAQQREFPRIVREAAEKSPDLRQMIDMMDGGDGMAYIGRLSRDMHTMAERGRYNADVGPMLQPYLDRGVISAQEFRESVERGFWTDMPALEREIAHAAGTPVQPLLERLHFLNQQTWADNAQMIFGQVDRSNMQRLLNSPLLYWPISYQIKATKWLASLLFERALGFESNAGGAVTLGLMHERYKEMAERDPMFGQTLSNNKALLFFAQMILPITPWDLGVSLSPFTRLALSVVTGDGSYNRNLFGVGPGYTYFELIPRVLYEQSKEGSLAQQTPFLGEVVRRLQSVAPFEVSIKPRGQAAEASSSVFDQPIPPPQAPRQPDNRLSP